MKFKVGDKVTLGDVKGEIIEVFEKEKEYKIRFSDGKTAIYVEGVVYRTNRQWLESLSDEELDKLLYKCDGDCQSCLYDEYVEHCGDKNTRIKWLQAEHCERGEL